MVRLSLIIRGPRSTWRNSSSPREVAPMAQLRGPMEGGARGAAPGRLFPVWQLAWLHGRSLTRPGDRNVPLAVPGMGGTQPPSAPQEGGISYCSGLSFQQPAPPHLPRKAPKMSLFVPSLRTSMPSSSCEPGICCGPRTQWSKAKACPHGATTLVGGQGRSHEGVMGCTSGSRRSPCELPLLLHPLL